MDEPVAGALAGAPDAVAGALADGPIEPPAFDADVDELVQAAMVATAANADDEMIRARA